MSANGVLNVYQKSQTKNNAQSVLGRALEGRRPRRSLVDDVDVVIPVIRGQEQPMQQHYLILFNILMIILSSDYY